MSVPPAAPPAGTRGFLDRSWQAVRPVLAGGAKAGLRWFEGTLHPWRRRGTRARLIRQRPVGSIVVLCYGNICRSPYAALVLQRALHQRGLATVVTQGGFFGPDRPANDRGRQVAMGRGVDLSSHRSRLVTSEEARTSGLVVVMEPYQARRIIAEFGAVPERVLLLGDLDPDPGQSRAIHDPYGLEVPVFDRTYDRIDRCIGELARLIDPGTG